MDNNPLALVQGFLDGTAEPYQWGILGGCITYVVTILVVLYMLVAGGSFRRMKEQAEAYAEQGEKAFQVPLTAKPRLYESLIEASRTLPLKPLIPSGKLTGKGVELVVLKPGAKDEAAVLEALFNISDGSPRYGHGRYDPIERIWRWLPAEEGPFETAAEMAAAWRRLLDEEKDGDSLRFYIRDVPSGYTIGAVRIASNCPRHLRAEIDGLWLTPAFRGTYAALDAAFLLLEHLFGTLGYRRVAWCCDEDNHAGKRLAARLGFSLEGRLRKHMVWRDANRDSALHAMTNADWRDGARDQALALLTRKAREVQLPVEGEEEEEGDDGVAVKAQADLRGEMGQAATERKKDK